MFYKTDIRPLIYLFTISFYVTEIALVLLISKSITETLKAEKKYLQHQSLQQAYSPLVPKYRRGDTKLKSSGGIIATMQSLLSSSDQSRDSHFVKSSQ